MLPLWRKPRASTRRATARPPEVWLSMLPLCRRLLLPLFILFAVPMLFQVRVIMMLPVLIAVKIPGTKDKILGGQTHGGSDRTVARKVLRGGRVCQHMRR